MSCHYKWQQICRTVPQIYTKIAHSCVYNLIFVPRIYIPPPQNKWLKGQTIYILPMYAKKCLWFKNNKSYGVIFLSFFVFNVSHLFCISSASPGSFVQLLLTRGFIVWARVWATPFSWCNMACRSSCWSMTSELSELFRPWVSGSSNWRMDPISCVI